MADARVIRLCAPATLASVLLLPVAAVFVATVAAAAGEPDPDAARTRSIVDCVTGCVTEAVGCAMRCADRRGGSEAPLCATACVQGHVGCLAGCGLQPAPAPPAA